MVNHETFFTESIELHEAKQSVRSVERQIKGLDEKDTVKICSWLLNRKDTILQVGEGLTKRTLAVMELSNECEDEVLYK